MATCAGCLGNQESMDADSSVSSAEGKKMSAELAKYLAISVIELVTPDIMYNGIPWPEEEFMKVTVERYISLHFIVQKCGRFEAFIYLQKA